MITPRFTCSQTEQSVLISIYCPAVRAADAEIHVDETLVSIHVNPYFLRLNFSHPLLEDDLSSARYDPSSGFLAITLTKVSRGQDFEDLDLLAKLLAPRTSSSSKPKPVIEVLSDNPRQFEQSTDVNDLTIRTENLSLEREEILRAAENDWHLSQEAPRSHVGISVQKFYGFLDLYTGYFTHVAHTENEVNELGTDAEICTADERRQKRLEHEDKKWDGEYYMADYADDEYIRELLRWKHPHTDHGKGFRYTDEENEVILRLPRKEYIPTPTQTHHLYLTLLTLLFSYAYESRTTQRDPTPESAWTLSTLVPAFSALDPPDLRTVSAAESLSFSDEELARVFITSYRRSLAFPLYRSFILAEACRNDVAILLSSGKRTVVRCLLEMKKILDHHEVYYVYSKIWVDDFCVWTQAYASNDTIVDLGKQVAGLEMKKGAIGWRLEALEAAAQESGVREADSDDEDSE